MLVVMLCGACVTALEPESGGCAPAERCSGVPVLVAGIPPMARIAAGAGFTCGIAASGEAWCWGDNTSGQLGAGLADSSSRPVAVTGGHKFSALALGAVHACGITTARAVWCWGSNGTRNLARDASPDLCGAAPCSRTPVQVAGIEAIAIAAGQNHTCAVDPAGAAWCWGFNGYGETGDSVFPRTRATPNVVRGVTRLAKISAGAQFTCALTSEGAMFCWGLGSRGQLARNDVRQCAAPAGFSENCSASPLAAGNSLRFTAISTSMSHGCGVASGDLAWCWGDGNGRMGVDYDATKFVQVTAGGRSAWTTIVAGNSVNCGTVVGGSSYCWGINVYGSAGTGTRVNVLPNPTEIAGGRAYLQFAAGAYHVCGLTGEGTVYCWGLNRSRQLGS